MDLYSSFSEVYFNICFTTNSPYRTIISVWTKNTEELTKAVRDEDCWLSAHSCKLEILKHDLTLFLRNLINRRRGYMCLPSTGRGIALPNQALRNISYPTDITRRLDMFIRYIK